MFLKQNKTMEPFAPNEDQQLRIKMVITTRETFMVATGHWPKRIHASDEFLVAFGFSGYIGSLEICDTQILPSDRGNDGLYCYAERKQLID